MPFWTTEIIDPLKVWKEVRFLVVKCEDNFSEFFVHYKNNDFGKDIGVIQKLKRSDINAPTTN